MKFEILLALNSILLIIIKLKVMNDDLTQENFQFRESNDPLYLQQASEEVISSRRICYFSNFDININDWFVEYENILIFQQNV